MKYLELFFSVTVGLLSNSMKHLIVFILVTIGFCIFSQANDELTMILIKQQKFQQKICEIINKANVKVNFVYKTCHEMNVNNLEKLSIEEILHTDDNEINFNRCLLQQPTIWRNLENFNIEPLRSSRSINIYFIDSKQTMQKIVTFLNSKQHWKHAHKYVFIWLLKDISSLRQFFEKVWQKNILFALAAVVNEQLIYTFEPFTPEGFQLKVLYKEPYFYDKLKNWYHYELHISMFTDNARAIPKPDFYKNGYHKVDGRVAATVVERLNATVRYIKPSDKDSYGSLINGSFTGSLKDINSGFAHIGFNLRFVVDKVQPHFEELYPYRKRLLYLLLPAAKMIPQYLIFVNAFSYNLWRLLILNFVCVLGIFLMMQYLVERIPNYFLWNSKKNYCWYEIVEIFSKAYMGVPLNKISQASSLRQFLISWILFGYLLTSIYIARLESSFVEPSYEPELDRLIDLDKLNVPILVSDDIIEAVKVSLDPKYYEIIARKVIRMRTNISRDDFTFAQARKLKNVAMILNDAMAKDIVTMTFNDETKRPSLHIVKEYLRSLTSSYIVTKGSPFIYKFQTLVAHILEAGLFNYWLEADEQQNKFLHRSEEFLDADFDVSEETAVGSATATMQEKKKVVLSLKVLQGAFYLWLAGICASCCGFAIELVYFWYQKRKLNV